MPEETPMVTISGVLSPSSFGSSRRDGNLRKFGRAKKEARFSGSRTKEEA